MLAVAAVLSTGAAADWRSSWDATLYGYARADALRSDSVVNPGKRVAGLAERSESGELRVNTRLENESLRLSARAIGITRTTHNDFGSAQRGATYLSQWQLRLRAADGWHLAAGREVLNWGPGQFRSPSSPLYFDNGRRDPLRELVGVDALKLAWTPDRQTAGSLWRIVGSGHGEAQPEAWQDSWLGKLDHRGEAWALGLVAFAAPAQPTFYGGHGQFTVGDALLLYGEAASAGLPQRLQSPADPALPFTLQAPSPRRPTTLLGASYSFEGGQSLAAEYLHDGHGYTAAEERAYFARAESRPAIALGLAPRLLGRDYLHLLWQSNLLDERGYGRLMYTRNLTDRGSEYAAYGEARLAGSLGGYLLAVLAPGEARQEFSALIRRSLTLGLKIALP